MTQALEASSEGKFVHCCCYCCCCCLAASGPHIPRTFQRLSRSSFSRLFSQRTHSLTLARWKLQGRLMMEKMKGESPELLNGCREHQLSSRLEVRTGLASRAFPAANWAPSQSSGSQLRCSPATVTGTGTATGRACFVVAQRPVVQAAAPPGTGRPLSWARVRLRRSERESQHIDCSRLVGVWLAIAKLAPS